MSDEKNPPGGFAWGLTPSSDPRDPKATPDAVEPAPGDTADDAPADSSTPGQKPEQKKSPTAGLDLGHFLALNQTEMIAAATEGHDSDDVATTDTAPNLPTVAPLDDEGEPTEAFDFRAPPPPPVDPIQPPVYHEGRALPWEQPPAFDSALDGATEVLGAEAVGMDTPEDESAPTSAIDSLFGAEKFEEYEDAPAQALVPFVPRELVPVAAPNTPASDAPKPPRGPLPKSQKVLIWVAGGLVAAIALVGLFFLGTRIAPDEPDAVATPAATAEPTAEAEAPVAPAAVLGPVAPGVYRWDDLLGTECVDPYANAWEKEYTVVDCAAPHGGQLVYRGRFEDSALDAFPGVEALQARMNLLCSSPDNIDYAAASQFADIQVAASFAGTEDDWKSGNRNYYCFVNRSSGEPLTGSVSTAPRAPVVIPVVPAPEP